MRWMTYATIRTLKPGKYAMNPLPCALPTKTFHVPNLLAPIIKNKYKFNFYDMKKIGYVFLLFIAFTSCKRSPAEINADPKENTSVVWNEENAGQVSEIAEDIKYIMLEAHPDALFNSEAITKILFKNDKILVFEKRGANAVFMYDIHGKFERRIGTRGGGPAEYTMLMGFAADDHFIYLFDTRTKRVLSYDYSGNYIKTLKLPVYSEDAAILENGDFLWANLWYLNEDGAKYRIALTDDQLNVKQELFKINDSDSKLTLSYYFGVSENNITYQNYVQDTLIVFNKKTGDYKTIYFEFPNKVPYEMRAEAAKLKGNYQYLSHIPALLIGKYVTGVVTGRPFILNIATGKIYFNDKGGLFGVPMAEYKGYVVAPLTSRAYQYHLKNGTILPLSDEYHRFFMADDDNVGLILYKLKQK